MSVLGDRIKSRRTQLNITQEMLADFLGKDQKQIWKYESGRTHPSALILIELAKILETTADYLLGLTDDPNRPLRNTNDLSELEKEIINILRTKNANVEQYLLNFLRVMA